MAAALTDKLHKVGTAGTLTALAAPGKPVGASSINVNSTTNWPTDTAVILAIRQVDASGKLVAGTYTEWVGTVSGTVITINPTPVYGTDQIYTAGSTTQVYLPVSSKVQNDLIDALLASHNQNGTMINDLPLTTPKITTGIKDANGNLLQAHTPTASAVNYISEGNAATGNNPSVGGTGSDGNVGFDLTTKGSGKLRLNGTNLLSGLSDCVVSGCVISITSGLAWSMTAGVVSVGGNFYPVSSASGSVTASKDTYFDVLISGTTAAASLVNTGGNIVANNAASPALAANSIRLGIVVSGASITSINQGSTAATAPVVSSNTLTVCDSLGNLIYPTPGQTLLGYRQVTGNFSTGSLTAVQVTGLSCPVVIPTGRRVRIMAFAADVTNNTATTNSMTLWDGTVGSGTQVAQANVGAGSATNSNSLGKVEAYLTPSTSPKTYNAALQAGAGTATWGAASTQPSFISVELV